MSKLVDCSLNIKIWLSRFLRIMVFFEAAGKHFNQCGSLEFPQLGDEGIDFKNVI